jgi:Carboxypeptidase regulatory-like domain
MRRITLVVLMLALASAVGTGAAFGQATASGTIQGTVLDNSQAAIAGAQVECSNKETAAVRTTNTSDAGYFRFDLLPIGT